ncbi:MAG: lytic murein transglycosylase, partial [Alphaproteobacteria bacterium]|nr:lytic murein transglycosylase [Alphaproteobacteria bacterium]
AAALLFTLSGHAQADAKFEAFIQTLWPAVKAAGFSRTLFDQAFAGITEPDATVIKLANTQPEFKISTGDYLGTAVTPIRIDTGKSAMAKNDVLMRAIEKKYGVDRYTIMGIWGMESNFGKDEGSMSVMRSLATLIYSGNKKDYARVQLLSAFRILKSGARTPSNFVGSWAGAMGHTQFIPSSYVSFAVDWNGDGKRDIWDTKEDALASTANYLAKAGWKNDRPWGWEVKLPDNFDRSLIGRAHWRTVSEWMKLGITQMNGKPFSAPQADSFVMIPQTINGPVFLVTRNFLAIMNYNQSHSYALAVGHLGDRIRGGAPFQATWPSAAVDLNPSQRVELQKRLNALGIETGGAADGRFGAQTYEAILTYQKKKGLPLDGQPTLKILDLLRKGG